MLNFDVKRLENKVLIDIENWLQNTNSITIHRMSGKSYLSYITRALEVGKITEDKSSLKIKKGDTILLTRVASEIAVSPTSYYTVNNKKYFNVPLSQIIGVFKEISLETLELHPDCILFEKLNKSQDSILDIPDTSATVGNVVKIGSNVKDIYGGDKVLVRDNVSTPIRLNEKDYFIVEHRFIVGLLEPNNLKILNNYIFLKPYISKNTLNSTILEAPEINYEELDYSDVYNRDLFEIAELDSNIKEVQQGDIVLINRDFTNYVFLENEKYFVIDGIKWIEGRIK